MIDCKFDDIRPYNQTEMLEAMERIAIHPNLKYISQFLYPGKPLEYIQSKLRQVETIKDFQLGLMYDGVESLIKYTTSGLTFSGFDKLDKDKSYLIISNHRDIMLDPALLQWCLIKSELNTSEISFGDNLLINQLYTDIGRSNKMFMVIRGGTMREMLKNSRHLSEYIRNAVTERNSSVWLAQRNGRSKDGIDTTDQGIFKMLSLSKNPDQSNIESFNELNILPMSISYEIEPCDLLKAREVLIKRTTGSYTKKEGEDGISIKTGMSQQKGRVHISVGNVISLEDLLPYEDLHINVLNHELEELLSKRIRLNYKLMPTNYIAHDILSGKKEYTTFYTDEEKAVFEKRMNTLIESENELDKSELKEIFLGIYANSVNSYLNAK